jgi:hypothetical protein
MKRDDKMKEVPKVGWTEYDFKGKLQYPSKLDNLLASVGPVSCFIENT